METEKCLSDEWSIRPTILDQWFVRPTLMLYEFKSAQRDTILEAITTSLQDTRLVQMHGLAAFYHYLLS